MPRHRYSYRRRSEDSSDENEDNFRHDRFRSERYPESNYELKQRYDNRERQRDRKRHRERSKSRSRSPHYRSRSPRSRSRSLKKEHKNSLPNVRQKKIVEGPSKKSTIENDTNTMLAKSKQKTNLSDLLKRFDESTKKESAQENSNGCSSSNTGNSILSSNDKEDLTKSNQVVVGPALPLDLQKPSLSEEKEECQQTNIYPDDRHIVGNTLCETSSEIVLSPVGSSLLTHSEKSSEDKTEEQIYKLDNVNKLEDRLPQDNISESCVEVTIPVDVQNFVSEEYLPSECQLPEITIGPALPPNLQNSVNEQGDENNENNSKTNNKNEPEYYGPSLPPSLKKDLKKVIGPIRPPDCKMEVENVQEESEEDEDFVGPVPEDSKERSSMVQQKLDLRAMEIKIKMLEGDNESSDVNKRESWMLELPPEKAASLGLGPRTFRIREGPDNADRSCWTDTPADKLQKLMKEGEDTVKSGKEELRKATLSERDRAMEELTKERSVDKPLSLLEIHQQNMRKKKMKEEQEGKKPERRPFDRNIDLQVNRFDEAQRKAIFKKAQLLDTRFSQGESKYL